MAYQTLQGIRITPKGAYNQARFGAWPISYAFGGWIYGADCSVGFSQQPTEITINVVMESKTLSPARYPFDIRREDIRCDAGNGADENLFDIDFNGVVFKDYVLYNYELSIESSVKTLKVTFKDYGVILDKIYVGLIKRQGNRFVHSASSEAIIPVNCADCLLTGSSVTGDAPVTRDISYGSYVGLNEGVYDNFDFVQNPSSSIFGRWKAMSESSVADETFDLNGGYLMLGTEEVSEERCGNLVDIKYSFNELLSSLRKRGLTFTGAFPSSISGKTHAYRQNYIGTLREVLSNWCSDLSLDFFTSGKAFVGVNTDNVVDITPVTNIVDPTTAAGRDFSMNADAVISSYRESSSIGETYRQAVITADVRPIQSQVSSKAVKRYVGFSPLHPLDFTSPNLTPVSRSNVFGECYTAPAIVNDMTNATNTIWTSQCGTGSYTPNRAETFFYTNRSKGEIDISIALSKYNQTLRDIYCGQRAIEGFSANFNALGFVPLMEITDAEIKSEILGKYKGAEEDIQTVVKDARYYKIYIGYYYEDFHNEVITWEKACASKMYKIGALTKSLLTSYPYTVDEVLQDASPAAGFYGESGQSLTRITHDYSPAAEKYSRVEDTPFLDTLIYSGLYLPTGYYYAQLDNEWGTNEEDFNKNLEYINTACLQKYAGSPGYRYSPAVGQIDGITNQSWNLEEWKPFFSSDIADFFKNRDEIFENIAVMRGSTDLIDNLSVTTLSIDGNTIERCQKLHIAIFTDVSSHPNVNISFNVPNAQVVNPVMLQRYQDKQRDAAEAKSREKTKSICEVPLLQELCSNLISGYAAENPQSGQYQCEVDPTGIYTEGFGGNVISGRYSRVLNIAIRKNPQTVNGVDFYPSDDAGYIYLDSLDEGEGNLEYASRFLQIIYPISIPPTFDEYYSGILTSTIETENRSPEVVEIYGEPVNRKNNNVSSIKIINNGIDPDIAPILNPYDSRFVRYTTLITGDGGLLTTVSGYHNAIKNLNGYDSTEKIKSVDISIAGFPNLFGTFKGLISPASGLTNFGLTMSDNGITTSLSFSDRPPTTPVQESIINKIGPRIK